MSLNSEETSRCALPLSAPENAATVVPQPTQTLVFQDLEMLAVLRASAQSVAQALFENAKERPALGEALGGRVLEVGAGLAALSLALAKLFPTTRFTAMDSNSSATKVAQVHVAASGFAARFAIRLRDLIHIDERASYNVAWLPAPFLPREGARIALDRLTLAIKPRGFLIIGNAVTNGDASATASTPRLLRSNGHLWRTEELSGILRHQGYGDIERLCCAGGIELSIARRP